MLGDAEIGSLFSVDPVFAYILYILFTFITVFVLLTMLIAIIGDAYNEIQEKYFKSQEARDAAAQRKKDILGLITEPIKQGLGPGITREEIELSSIRDSQYRSTIGLNTPTQANNTTDPDEESGSGEVAEILKKILRNMEDINVRIKKLEEKK